MAGCGRQSDGVDCLCSNDFESVHVVAVNDTGGIESGVTTVTRNAQTGDTIRVVQVSQPGWITLIDDSCRDSLPALDLRGDSLLVRGVKDTRSFQAVVTVAVDPCRCHVYKLAGPDTVVLR